SRGAAPREGRTPFSRCPEEAAEQPPEAGKHDGDGREGAHILVDGGEGAWSGDAVCGKAVALLQRLYRGFGGRAENAVGADSIAERRQGILQFAHLIAA